MRRYSWWNVFWAFHQRWAVKSDLPRLKELALNRAGIGAYSCCYTVHLQVSHDHNRSNRLVIHLESLLQLEVLPDPENPLIELMLGLFPLYSNVYLALL